MTDQKTEVPVAPTVEADVVAAGERAAEGVVEPPQFKKQRSRTSQALIDLIYPVVTLAVVILGWEAWVNWRDVPSYLIPTPSSAFAEMVEQSGFLWDQLWVTAQETIYGYVISVLLGIPIAIAIAGSRFVEKCLYPLLVASQVFPKVALAPVFLIWLGFGIASKVLIVILIAFFPIVVNGVIGLQSVEQEKIYLARSMGASSLKTFTRIKLPHSLPALFGGLKLAAIFAVVGAVVGEFIGADAGLGRTLLLANGNLNTRLLFATIGYLTLFGVAFYLVIDIIERISIPWHLSKRRTE